TAGRFEVRDGDTPVDSGERSEVRSEDRFDVVDGDERWYSFSLKFDDGFSNPRRLVHPDAVAWRRRGRRRLRRVTATEPGVFGRRANMDTPRAYYKLGLYRDPEISGTMV